MYDASEVDVRDREPVLDSIEPQSMYEGEGRSMQSAAMGLQPIDLPGSALDYGYPVLLRGINFAADAIIRVELRGDGGGTGSVGGVALPILVGDTWVSDDGSLAATTFHAPVNTLLGHAEELVFDVILSQGDSEVAIPFTLIGLDELELLGGVYDATTQFRELYSTIRFLDDVEFVGTRPMLFAATGDILIDSVLSVAGLSGDEGGQGGAGGCSGGAAGSDSNCGNQGGGLAPLDLLSGAGGGGGANLTNGLIGGGTGGLGGLIAVDPLLTILPGVGSLIDIDLFRLVTGNGGGGGAGGLLLNGLLGSGGAGGGGGGLLALTAGGVVAFTQNAFLTAAGGAGGAGSLVGGGGGGGSGGALSVVGIRGIDLQGAGPWLEAPGGLGGTGLFDGGNGGLGRIRIDSPVAVPSLFDTIPVPVRGPAFGLSTPSIVFDANINITIIGQGGLEYGLLTFALNETNLIDLIGGGGNVFEVPVELEPGFNQLCAVTDVDMANFANQDDNQHCTSIVYLPVNDAAQGAGN
ncbi:hypothetical protein [Haliangium ochraceum]|uniref:hypothetical protein n=1 Tax=Haliangium ochraceum TaxID=80816 RepID=UPI00126A3ED7|nr:hypothetical protein [Haliangium ochraceum]